MKKTLRKSMIQNRMNLSKNEVNEKSDKIFLKLKENPTVNKATNILLYMDFRNEVKTDKIINYLLENHKNVFIPKVNKASNELDIYEIKGNDDLILSNYGIKEPNSDLLKVVNPKEIDLILSPGVAFTKECYRIGYGGGFYDKLLTKTNENIITIALAFEMQIVDSLPIESHDKQLDFVQTEEKLYKK